VLQDADGNVNINMGSLYNKLPKGSPIKLARSMVPQTEGEYANPTLVPLQGDNSAMVAGINSAASNIGAGLEVYKEKKKILAAEKRKQQIKEDTSAVEEIKKTLRPVGIAPIKSTLTPQTDIIPWDS